MEKEETVVVAPVRKTPVIGIVALVLSILYVFVLFGLMVLGMIPDCEELVGLLLAANLAFLVLLALPVGLAVGSIVQHGSARTLPIISLVISGLIILLTAAGIVRLAMTAECDLFCLDDEPEIVMVEEAPAPAQPNIVQ